MSPRPRSAPRLPAFAAILLSAFVCLTQTRTARPEDPDPQLQASTQARGIHTGQIILAQGRNAHFSDDLPELVHENYFTPAYALSPLSKKQIPDDYNSWPQSQQDEWLRKNSSYILIPGLTDDTNQHTAAVFLRPEDSNDSGMAVAFNDNHVEWLPKKEARLLIEKQTGMTLEQLIARQANYRPPPHLLFARDALDLTLKTTLNPDGSGKAVLDVKMILQEAILHPPDAPKLAMNTDSIANTMFRQVYLHSAGVEAWKDVACQATPDGHVRLTGTAYFKSIDKFSLGDMLQNNLSAQWLKDPAGGMTLTVQLLPPPAPGPAPAPRSLNNQQVDQLIADTRALWDGMKQTRQTMMEATRFDLTVSLPGAENKSTIFQSVPAGVHLLVDGRKIPAAVDKWLDVESNLKLAIKNSQNWAGPENLLTPSQDALYQALFGQKGAITAHVAGELKPLFDYPAESAAAKAAQAEMLKKLLAPPPH